MPQVTVIIPTWNRAKWLKMSIESVLSQTFQDFELIVVDDASTDSTGKILESYSGKIRTILSPENLGVSAARNTAIVQSDSKWIAFLDSDDYWHAEKLEKQIKQTRLYPEYQIHFTDEIWIRNGIIIEKNLAPRDLPHPSAMVLSKDHELLGMLHLKTLLKGRYSRKQGFGKPFPFL